MRNVTVAARPDGSHDIGIGSVVVNTKDLKPADVLRALCNIAVTAMMIAGCSTSSNQEAGETQSRPSDIHAKR